MNCFIVTGVYGAGKTEFCVNFALSLGPCVKLADMDILNPYFRSREKADFLLSCGVEVIGNLTQNSTITDVPAISGEVLRSVLSGEKLVVDLAGSTTGLNVLTFFKEYLAAGGYNFWLCVNAFREESNTPAKVLDFISRAEKHSGLKISGLINNSHMLRETTRAHILAGETLVREVLQSTGKPVVYTFLHEGLYNEVKNEITSPVLVFKDLIMREDWL
jgi:hypothetical protein